MDFHTIPGEDQTFVCSQEGEGPDAVLVHGFPDTPHSFAALQAALSGGGWRVTVPWLRGYHPNTIVPGRRYGLTISDSRSRVQIGSGGWGTD